MSKSQLAISIENWLVSHLARRLGADRHEINIRQPFVIYGLASLEGINMVRELGEWLNCTLSPTVVWDFPSVEALASHLANEPTILEQSTMSSDIKPPAGMEPIAIIGMSCRYPGADSPEALWRLLCNGVDAITEIPVERWDLASLYHPDQTAPGKMTTRWGGFLDRLEEFDANFFGISPREAPHVDPRQRVMLEIAWEALEDAGIPPESIAGSQTGVFIATLSNDYDKILFKDYSIIESYSGPGTANSIVANRLSYFLDLRGPCVALDTACSGSLVALHLACQSLERSESTLALVGGVSINLLPDGNIFFSKAGVLSKDGHCKTFDSRADGIVRSDGGGLIVLKPLSLAQADGDKIYAVIRGTAVNHDGRSNGIMAPNGEAQKAVLKAAYQQAGVSPGQVQYIEAHGTGTSLGDPIEVKALGTVLSQNRIPDRKCVLGSIKTNIGHTESAAGIAGVIKSALSLSHRLIPPTLHFQNPNPLIPFDELPFVVQQEVGPWPCPSQPLLAGVSGFGFGGTNAHVVLQEAPPRQSESAARGGSRREETDSAAYLLPLSARTPEALRALAQAYQPFVLDDKSPALPDICYTASVRRTHFDVRLALVAHSKAELAEKLAAYLAADPPPLEAHSRSASQPRKLAFIFSGQGSHWYTMGSELLEKEPVFRSMLTQCDRLLREHVEWSLLEELSASEGVSRLNETEVTQSAIFAIQVALATLWQSWGVVPDVVVGHSLGEVAAAYVAGCVTLEDALRVVFHRSRLMKTVAGQGKTAVVGLPLEQARFVIMGHEDLLSVAGSNSPTTSVLSGDPQALERVLASLKGQGIFCRLLQGVDIAFHSLQMDPLKEQLVQALCGLSPRPASIPIFSTVKPASMPVTSTAFNGNGKEPRVSLSTKFDAQYWGQNLREPFLFTEVMKQLFDSGYDMFLEVSPHPVLASSILQGLHHSGREGTVLPSLRRRPSHPEGTRPNIGAEGEQATMLASLGALYTGGHSVEWSQLCPTSRDSCPTEYHCVSLPTYPWQRERYWFDQLPGSHGTAKKAGGHPLLGEHLKSAATPQHFWEIDLSTYTPHYLADHRVLGSVMLPGAAILSMARAAAKQAGLNPVVEEVTFEQALRLPEEEIRRVQLVISPNGGGEGAWTLYSRPINGANNDEAEAWTRHASGLIAADSAAHQTESISRKEIRARCWEAISVAEHYSGLQAQGLQYGPSFQAVKQLWRGDWEALGQIQLPPTLVSDGYAIHPVLLDASFQVVAQIKTGENEIYLPQGVKSWRLTAPNELHPEGMIWCHARLRSPASEEMLEADIDLFNDSGQVIGEVVGLRLQRLNVSQRARPKKLTDWLYEVQWQPQAHLKEPSIDESGHWLIFADRTVGKALASQLEARGETAVLVYPTQSVSEPVLSHESLAREYWLNPAHLEEFQRLFDDVLSNTELKWRGIVYLWGLEAALPEDGSQAHLSRALRLSGGSVLHLIQALTGSSSPDLPRLWIVTQKAQPVGAFKGEVAVAQASLWGVGRVAALELADLWGGLVDLDEGSPAREASLLCEELLNPNGEDQIAFREGQRYVARLRAYESTSTQPFHFRVDGSYLITGGLSGLGFQVARWMVQQGARRLILLGRTKLPDRATWDQLEPQHPAASRVAAIQELEMMGASTHFASVDVANEAQLSSFLQQYKQEGFPPIRGVLHSAGLIRDQLLMRMDDETFQSVLRPKVNGAWALHQATEDTPLEFFILFSSATSLLGQYGQANYAAGNAFMDALAHYRRARGLPALSINWGPWAEVGMFARLDSDIKRTGVEAIPPEEGLRILAHLSGPTQVAVIGADWRQMPHSALLSELIPSETDSADSTEANMAMLELLLAAPEERQSMLEHRLCEAAAKVLQLDPTRLDIWNPLTTWGLDSLMAIELKNRLEISLGLTVSMADLFTRSVAQLAERLTDQVQGDNETLTDLLVEIEQLSMDDVQALLASQALG